MDEIIIKIEPLDSDAEDDDDSTSTDGTGTEIKTDSCMQEEDRPSTEVERHADIGQATLLTTRKEVSNFVQPEVQLMPTDDVRDNLDRALAQISQAIEIPLDIEPQDSAVDISLDVQPEDPVSTGVTVIKHIEGVASNSVCDSIFRNLNKASVEIGKTFVEASRPGNYADQPFSTGPYRGPYRCDQCGKIFTVWRSFMTHTKTHQAPHKCMVCEKVFTSKHDLHSHQEFHSGESPLAVDEVTVAFVPSANNSQIVHSGEHPHECSICGKVFDSRRKLRRHAVHHVGEKPFRCKICDLAFEKPHQLRSHGKVHNAKKKHQCSHCGQKFKIPFDLTEHERVHTGEKPYKCDYCPGIFARQSSLRRHLKAHTGVKAYKCRFCDKSYREGYLLRDHERVHTGEMPYQCEHCNDSFRLLCQLKRHKLLEHPSVLQASLIGAQAGHGTVAHPGDKVVDKQTDDCTTNYIVDQYVQ